MTEKRFTTNIHRIYDNDEEIACADTMGDAEILVDLLNEQDKEIKRLKCINRQLEERLDKSVALDMSKCGKYVFGVHGGSND